MARVACVAGGRGISGTPVAELPRHGGDPLQRGFGPLDGRAGEIPGSGGACRQENPGEARRLTTITTTAAATGRLVQLSNSERVT